MAARWSAFSSRAASGGTTSTWTSGSWPAASRSSARTALPSGLSVAPHPASTSRHGTYFRASRKAVSAPLGSVARE